MSSWNTTRLGWGLALVLALAVAESARAQSGFFKLGEIGAEAQANGMEILGISWGGPTMNMGPMDISATPPPDARTVRILKRVDKSTPLIAQALARNQRFPVATLTVPKGGGSQEYLEIKLENVIISSYQTGGTQDSPTETLSLNFTEIKFDYSEKKLAAPAGPEKAGYDLKKVEEGAARPGEGPPAAGLVAAVADLLPLNGLTVATIFIPWGQTATVSTDAASSKQGGRCFFRYRYDTGNQGQAGAGATTNRIHLDAANGPSLADDALAGLAAGDQQTSSGLLPLVVGTWTLYVHVDDDLLVAEGDEQNNLRRVRVRVEGSCDDGGPTRKDATPPTPSSEQPSGAVGENPSNWLRVGAVHTGNDGEALFQMSGMQAEKVVVRGWDPEQARNANPESLEIEVMPGGLQDELRQAHRTGKPVDLILKLPGRTKWEHGSVHVTSYAVSGATDAGPRLAVFQIISAGRDLRSFKSRSGHVLLEDD
ncbi:MAG TPA: type VI secretion system tube protein Hcp [Gemmatimonadota bacterium]|nr:type VI secretion system tube protein Hcp [Gemmatimonadota bacterium]